MTDHITKVAEATEIILKNQYRPLDSYGNPGGLIELSGDNRMAIIIGDLHGSIENLKAIVSHENNRGEIENGESVLIIIGDGLHNDQVGHMREMDSSLKVLDELIHLICTYGERVIYIRGNHDSFEERLVKSGIHQGKEFKDYLLKHRNSKYVQAVDNFFKSLPMFIIGKGWIITHAGPIRNGATRQELIDITDNPYYYEQLMWNRIHEFRGTPSLKEYGDYDIQKMLERLHLPPDTPFIVGHNPMWHTGNTTGIWKDVTGIKNHIIICSNIGTRGPYLKIFNGKIEEKFAVPKKPEAIYV